MKNDDSARRIQDMQIVPDTIKTRLKTDYDDYDSQRTAAEIVKLRILMERLLVLNVVDFHSLSLARTLVRMDQPKVALDRLENILHGGS